MLLCFVEESVEALDTTGERGLFRPVVQDALGEMGAHAVQGASELLLSSFADLVGVGLSCSHSVIVGL